MTVFTWIRVGLIASGIAGVLAAGGCGGSSDDTSRPKVDAGKGGGGTGGGGTGGSGTGGSGADAGACVPKTCAELKAECGTLPDGCNGTLDCGTCSTDQFCGGAGPNQCGTTRCIPKTCAGAGADCGSVS